MIGLRLLVSVTSTRGVVTRTGAPTLPTKLASPAYSAVMFPIRLVTAIVAADAAPIGTSGAVPIGCPSCRKRMEPVGAPAPGATGDTTAVNGPPVIAVTVVLVFARATTTV